ncbi:MAG: hypothetical protein J6Y78_11050 [Paludibacteraceae bacterium]|nr:hypothetical protein [Paludibacteraceae bacterium]
MTRFTVPIANILGLSYYRYELTSNNYNPKINTSVTISCKVTNVFGTVVNGKSLTLYYKGTSQGTQTTNSNGVAEWAVNVGDTGGTFRAEVNQESCTINVTGYKQIKSYSSGFYTLSINELTRTARLSLNTNGSKTFNSGASYEQTGWIPSDYRPPTNVNIIIARNISLSLNIGTNGNVSIYNPSSQASADTSASIYYDY